MTDLFSVAEERESAPECNTPKYTREALIEMYKIVKSACNDCSEYGIMEAVEWKIDQLYDEYRNQTFKVVK